MKILFVSATPFEITPLTDFLKQNWVQFGAQQYQKGEHSVEYLITGVGIPATIFQLTKKLSNNPFDLVINAGIAGAFNRAIELGSVWEVVEDRFADIGVEQADESNSISNKSLSPNEPPFKEYILQNNETSAFNFLPKASAITVNKVHGFPDSIEKIRVKYPADLESMEGAAVFYVTQLMGQSVLQIRSVSNYVEKRNRANWEIGLAIEQLNKTIIELIQVLS